MPVMTAAALAALLAREFPPSRPDGRHIAEVRDMDLRARCRPGEERLRPGGTVAEAGLAKLGRRLAMGEVTIFGAPPAPPVARGTVTCAIPPRTGEEPAANPALS